jgi:hypothetical protein
MSNEINRIRIWREEITRALCILLSLAIILLILTISTKRSYSAERCFIVGDSIAEMIQKYLPQCRHNTRIGISTPAVIKRMHDAGTVIISTGSNDMDTFAFARHLDANLAALRAMATGRVIWVAPVNARASEAVRAVADSHKDAIATFTPGHDDIHPGDPVALALMIEMYIK